MFFDSKLDTTTSSMCIQNLNTSLLKRCALEKENDNFMRARQRRGRERQNYRAARHTYCDASICNLTRILYSSIRVQNVYWYTI